MSKGYSKRFRDSSRRAKGAEEIPDRVASEPFRLGYRPGLDGMRAVAVLTIMCWHFGMAGLKGGFLGVDVFFVLSGFLITSLLIEEWHASGAIHLGRFYMRRVLRLFPALLVVLAVTAPFVPRLYTLEAFFYVANWGVPLGTFGVSPIRHLWSLSVEEQFYLTWPTLLVLLLRSRAGHRTIYWVVGLLALASTIFKVVAWSSPGSWVRLYHGSDARADALLIGCGLGLFMHWSLLPRKRWFRSAARVAAIPALFGLSLLFWYAAVYWEFLYREAGLALADLAIAIVLLQYLVQPFRWMAAVLEWKPMVLVGRMSYSLYLWHQPVGSFLAPERFESLSRVPLFLLRLALTCALAALSYFLIERPVLKLKHRFSPRQPA